MMSKSKARGATFLSLAVFAVGLVFLLTGMGPRFSGSGGYTVDYMQLAVCVLLVTALSFGFGALRYSVASGFALGAAALHDQLIALALTALVGIAVPQMHLMPVMVVLACVLTFAHSLPVIRTAMELRSNTSQRDMTQEQVAFDAAKQTCAQRRITAGIAVVLLVAAAVGGGMRLAGWLLPVLAGLLASLVSARCLTPLAWAMAPHRGATKRTKR